MKDNNTKNNNNNDLNTSIKNEIPTIYTNSASFAIGEYDFQFVFYSQYPSFDGKDTDSNNFVRLIMSPQHAKVFSIILQHHIKKYEEDFGKINIDKTILEDLNAEAEE